jgi:hypothetical protein
MGHWAHREPAPHGSPGCNQARYASDYG